MLNRDGKSLSQFQNPDGVASVHLDALRGIAAIGVCLSHLRGFFFQDYSQLPHHNLLLGAAYVVTGLGHQWVIVFLVLSGYLVGGSVLRSMNIGRWEWRGYLLNRMTRLYTVLIPALALGGLLDVAGIHLLGESGIYGGHTGAHEVGFAISSRLSVSIMLGNYAFLQGIYVPTLGSNGPLWSLSYEFWYYIAFPFLAAAAWPGAAARKRVLNGVLLVAVLVFMRSPIAMLGLTWLMGVAIHYLPQLPVKKAMPRRLVMIAALAAFGGTLAWCKETHDVFTDYVLGLAVTGLIYAVLNCARRPMPKSYNRTARILSRSSYTLYLVHVPFLVFIAAWTVQKRWVPNVGSVFEGCVIFAVTMLYAQVVWFFFERRTDEVRAWLKPRVIDIGSRRKSRETAARV